MSPSSPKIVLALALGLGSAWISQETAVDAKPAAEAKASEPPAADPADVATVDSILDALYDVISGAKGEARDWDRFRSLFHPDLGALVPLRHADGKSTAMPMTPDGYVERSTPWFERQSFYEIEIERRVERFGNLAQVWSTYSGRESPDAETPLMQGINAIQLMNDGSRWYVLRVVWEAEREGLTLPDAYLPK